MSFDAGAITGRMRLDRKGWDSSVQAVNRSQEQLKSRFKTTTESFKQNWIMAVAAVTAAIMALRKAFQYVEIGARAQQIEDSFKSMANAVGIHADTMRKSIMAATKETVNFSNVAAGASALMATGLGMEEISALFERARGLARIFGQDTEAAVQVLVSAITGQLVTTLRRAYGLNVSLAVAVERYAEATGKSAEEVKNHYMAQAVYNEILEATKGHMAAVNLEVMTQYEQIQKLKARWTSFTETIGQLLLKLFAIVQYTFQSITALILANISNILGVLSRIPIVGNKIKEWAEITNQAMQMTFDQAIQGWNDVWATIGEGAEDTGQFLLQQLQSMGDGLDELTDKAAQSFDFMTELGKQAARNIQDAFSNFFFKAFTGELRSLRDVFADFGRAILQMISNILAQVLVVKMFTSMGLGSLLGHQEGIDSVPQTGLYKLHAGEKVTRASETGERTEPITIYNMITPEAVAGAMAGREGEGVIVNVIDRNSLRGGAVQRTIRRR